MVIAKYMVRYAKNKVMMVTNAWDIGHIQLCDDIHLFY